MWEERQRNVLLEGKAALERTSQSLQRSEQAAIETEVIGTNVIEELAQQREVLVRTNNRLGDIDVSLSKSSQIANFMKRGVCMNKLILILIIILEICILCALIYLRFLR